MFRPDRKEIRYMNEIEHLKAQIFEALQAVKDTDLLDLVLKLLLAEG